MEWIKRANMDDGSNVMSIIYSPDTNHAATKETRIYISSLSNERISRRAKVLYLLTASSNQKNSVSSCQGCFLLPTLLLTFIWVYLTQRLIYWNGLLMSLVQSLAKNVLEAHQFCSELFSSSKAHEASKKW